MKRYLRLFYLFIQNGFSTDVASPLDFWTFFVGKIIRMSFFFTFLFSIFRAVPNLAGYDFPTVVLIFATYNIVDVTTQLLFFRGFFLLQEMVRNGRFDMILTQPIAPLFAVAFRKVDYMDLLTLVPIGGLFFWSIHELAIPIAFTHVVLYLFFIMNSIVLTFSFALFLASLTFFTYHLEYTWWLYRFTLQAGRYPIEIFREPMRFILTWIFPLGLVMTFPVRALLGILSVPVMITSFVMGVVFFYCALLFWRHSIRRYTSASS